MPILPSKTEERLREAARAYNASHSLRDMSAALGMVDDRPVINYSTLADFIRGHPVDRPSLSIHLRLYQAEALANLLGLKIKMVR